MSTARPMIPFWDQREVGQVFERVRRYEFPVAPEGSGWKYGCDVGFLPPTSFSWYPDPRHPKPPRSIVEKGYDVERWSELPRGGHFPAMDVPELWIDDVRSWARACPYCSPSK